MSARVPEHACRSRAETEREEQECGAREEGLVAAWEREGREVRNLVAGRTAELARLMLQTKDS